MHWHPMPAVSLLCALCSLAWAAADAPHSPVLDKWSEDGWVGSVEIASLIIPGDLAVGFGQKCEGENV